MAPVVDAAGGHQHSGMDFIPYGIFGWLCANGVNGAGAEERQFFNRFQSIFPSGAGGCHCIPAKWG